MSDLLPLFPLPNVVLFPNVFLPLHVFEARYREMVADALQGDRLIGMVLLRPGWEHGYEGRPAVFPVGCVGVITHVEQLDNGRYNIVLRGVERFRIVSEDHSRSYRSAVIEVLPETPLGPEDRARLARHRDRLEGLLAPAVEKAGADPRTTSGMSDEDLINALAQYLDLEPLERQALLEQNCLRSRAEALVELLEMKILVARTSGLSNVTH
jgi:Lon protease-like protein